MLPTTTPYGTPQSASPKLSISVLFYTHTHTHLPLRFELSQPQALYIQALLQLAFKFIYIPTVVNFLHTEHIVL